MVRWATTVLSQMTGAWSRRPLRAPTLGKSLPWGLLDAAIWSVATGVAFYWHQGWHLMTKTENSDREQKISLFSPGIYEVIHFAKEKQERCESCWIKSFWIPQEKLPGLAGHTKCGSRCGLQQSCPLHTQHCLCHWCNVLSVLWPWIWCRVHHCCSWSKCNLLLISTDTLCVQFCLPAIYVHDGFVDAQWAIRLWLWLLQGKALRDARTFAVQQAREWADHLRSSDNTPPWRKNIKLASFHSVQCFRNHSMSLLNQWLHHHLSKQEHFQQKRRTAVKGR